jgi:hypothetical protein
MTGTTNSSIQNENPDSEPVAWFLNMWNEADEVLKSEVRWGSPSVAEIGWAEHNGHDIEYLYDRAPVATGRPRLDREVVARSIDPPAWERHDVIVGFFQREVGADTHQETYGRMWRAGVRTPAEATAWLLQDDTIIGYGLTDSLAAADRVVETYDTAPLQQNGQASSNVTPPNPTRPVTDDPTWIVVKERDLLRQAIVRYGDRSRMGTVEPQELQQAIDDAFEAVPAEQTRFSVARSMIDAGYFDTVHAVAPSLVEDVLANPVRETPWKWYAGQNDEWFALGPFDTREELLKQAEGERLGEFFDDTDGAWKLAFHVVEARSDSLRLADYVDVESLLERADERLESSDRMTEVDEGPIFDCSPEEQLDLELRIKGTCNRWQAIHGVKFHVKSFSHTRNGERVALSRPIWEKIGSDA